MVKIRLRRVGAKKQPHYRVVVADSRSPRDGRFIEVIGHYNPRTEPPTVQIDGERALYWLGVGAQPTAAVHRMLDKLGIMARFEAHKLGELPIAEAEVEPEERSTAEPAGLEQPEAEAEPEQPEDEDLWEYSEDEQYDLADEEDEEEGEEDDEYDLEDDEDDLEDEDYLEEEEE